MRLPVTDPPDERRSTTGATTRSATTASYAFTRTRDDRICDTFAVVAPATSTVPVRPRTTTGPYDVTDSVAAAGTTSFRSSAQSVTPPIQIAGPSITSSRHRAFTVSRPLTSVMLRSGRCFTHSRCALTLVPRPAATETELTSPSTCTAVTGPAIALWTSADWDNGPAAANPAPAGISR